MRFYKEVWGIIWEFNSIGEFVEFTIGRIIGAIIFFGCIYLLVTCEGEKYQENEKDVPFYFYDAKDLRYDYSCVEEE